MRLGLSRGGCRQRQSQESVDPFYIARDVGPWFFRTVEMDVIDAGCIAEPIVQVWRTPRLTRQRLVATIVGSCRHSTAAFFKSKATAGDFSMCPTASLSAATSTSSSTKSACLFTGRSRRSVRTSRSSEI